MSENTIPRNPGEAIILSGQMVEGLATLGTTLGITQITVETMDPLRSALINAQTAFAAARVAQQSAADAFDAKLAELKDWVGAVRNALVPHLGNRWSTEWVGTGFVPSSTAVPRTIAGLFGVVAAMGSYLTAHPTYAVPATGVTAVKADELNGQINGARMQWNAAKALAGEKMAARDTALAAMRTMMSGLVGILKMILGPLDPRWLQFGLNEPGADSTPGQPQNFTAMETPELTIMAQCDPTPLATRYRWRMKVVGVDTEFRLAASTPAPLAVISGVEPGQTVELFVQAVNGSAQGVPTDTVTVTLLAAPSAAPALPAPAEEIASTPETNGDRPGHAKHGHRGNGSAVKAAR